MRKLILLTKFFLSFSICVYAQTPRAFQNVGNGLDTTIVTNNRGISANNFWLGAQIGYKFGGTQEFSDNLLVSGRLLYDIDMGNSRFKIPVMGNISTLRNAFSDDNSPNKDTLEAQAQELLLSTQGINVGLYPYFKVNTKSEVFSLIIHGSTVWRLNSFKGEGDENIYLDQGRFSVGLEASLGKIKEDKAPLVISITPTLTVFDKDKYEKVFKEKRSSVFGLEVTGIVPLGKSVGLLIENIVAQNVNSTFRVGLIFSSPANKGEQ